MKQRNSYIFTSDLKHDQMRRRESITRFVNNIMYTVSEQFPDKPNITSHSFRVGYRTRLWKDIKIDRITFPN